MRQSSTFGPVLVALCLIGCASQRPGENLPSPRVAVLQVDSPRAVGGMTDRQDDDTPQRSALQLADAQLPPSEDGESVVTAEFSPTVPPLELPEAEADESEADGNVEIAEGDDQPDLLDFAFSEDAIPPAPTFGHSLSSLIETAIANNPAIQESSAAVAEAEGVRTQVGLLPNPTLNYSAEEVGNEDAAGLHSINISQQFVTADKLRLNRGVVAADVQRLRWQVEVQRSRIRTDVAQAFYSALAAQRREELATKFAEVAERGVRLAEERLEAGEGTKADVLQAEVQASQVVVLRRQSAVALKGAKRQLASVVGVAFTDDAPLNGQLEDGLAVADFESLHQSLVAGSPQIQAALAEVTGARRNLQRQGVQAIPNVTGQLGLGRDASSDDTFVNFGISVPLPVHNRNQGNISRANADYCRATQKVQRLQLQLKNRLAAVVQDYEVATVALDEYQQTILPKAEAALALAEEAYTAGEFDFLRVLTARRNFFEANFQSVALAAQAARQKALLDGFLLSGGLLDAADYQGDDGLRGLSLSGQ